MWKQAVCATVSGSSGAVPDVISDYVVRLFRGNMQSWHIKIEEYLLNSMRIKVQPACGHSRRLEKGMEGCLHFADSYSTIERPVACLHACINLRSSAKLSDEAYNSVLPHFRTNFLGAGGKSINVDG